MDSLATWKAPTRDPSWILSEDPADRSYLGRVEKKDAMRGLESKLARARGGGDILNFGKTLGEVHFGRGGKLNALEVGVNLGDHV